MWTCRKPSSSSARRTARTSSGATPLGRNAPISSQSERSTMVSLVSRRTPQRRSPSARAQARLVAHAVVVPVHQRRDVDLRVVEVGEGRGGRDGVAAVGGDQGVRHGADALAAPPRGLRVGADADGAGDVRGVPVAGLHPVVVEARREEEDRLAAGGVDHAAHVGADERAPRERAEVHRLEVGEEAVVALDGEHRLPGGELVAVVAARAPRGRPSRPATRAPRPRRRSGPSTGGASPAPRPCRRAPRRPSSGRPAWSRGDAGPWPRARAWRR